MDTQNPRETVSGESGLNILHPGVANPNNSLNIGDQFHQVQESSSSSSLEREKQYYLDQDASERDIQTPSEQREGQLPDLSQIGSSFEVGGGSSNAEIQTNVA